MRLTERESKMIRQVAFYKNVMEQNIDSNLTQVLASIPEKKHSLVLSYYEFLTTLNGKKSYTVDFKASGAGYLTFHDCTAEEAIEKTLEKLENGAFGKKEKLDDIRIEKVHPETINYNLFDDFLQWESESKKLA